MFSGVGDHGMFDHWKYTATREHGSVNNKDNVDREEKHVIEVRRGRELSQQTNLTEVQGGIHALSRIP